MADFSGSVTSTNEGFRREKATFSSDIHDLEHFQVKKLHILAFLVGASSCLFMERLHKLLKLQHHKKVGEWLDSTFLASIGQIQLHLVNFYSF